MGVVDDSKAHFVRLRISRGPLAGEQAAAVEAWGPALFRGRKSEIARLIAHGHEHLVLCKDSCLSGRFCGF